MNDRLKDQLKIILIALGTFLFLFTSWNGAAKLTEIIQHDLDAKEYNKEHCISIGGKVEQDHTLMTPLNFECVGYDEDGFKFYYKIDEDGEVYKVR